MSNQDFVLSTLYSSVNGSKYNRNEVDDTLMLTKTMYLNHLVEMCANRFEWTGLPESVDPRYLEMILLQRAYGVFFRDKADSGDGTFSNTNEFFFLPGAGGGMPNIQDIPTKFTVTALDQTINATLQATGPDKACVPIFANYLRIPEWDKILLFSHKLAEISHSIEINGMQMRHPVIISVPENKRMTYKNLMKQVQAGQFAIFGTEMLSSAGMEETVNVLNTGINPDTISKLWDAKNQLWNECMTMLGINNANQDKRERLVAAEVSANDDQIRATRNIALNARQQAAEQINKLWPELDVWVEFRSDEGADILPEAEENENEGDKE